MSPNGKCVGRECRKPDPSLPAEVQQRQGSEGHARTAFSKREHSLLRLLTFLPIFNFLVSSITFNKAPLETTIVLFAIIFVAGEVVPYFVMRSRGIKLSFADYNSPLIKKTIVAINHNNKVFDALQIVQKNNLEISIQEIENMYNANMNFNEIVDAMALAKHRNVSVTKEVLRELAFFNKDLIEIVKNKNAGEAVILAEVVTNYVIQEPVDESKHAFL